MPKVDSTFVVIDISGDAPEKTQDVENVENVENVEDVEDVENVENVENVEDVDVANQKRIASKTLFIAVFIIVLIVIAIAIWRTVVIFG